MKEEENEEDGEVEEPEEAKDGSDAENDEDDEDDEESEDNYTSDDDDDQAAEEAAGGSKEVRDEDDQVEEEEQENFDHLPQDRPKVIRYTKQMILDFIANESQKVFKDEYIFDDLVREVTIVTRGDLGFSKTSRGGTRRGYNSRGGAGGYNRGRGGRGGGGYNNRGNDYQSGPKQPVLQRQMMTSEQREKMKEMRQAAGDNWAERNKEGIDELESVKREINLSLFQLTEENFDSCYNKFRKYCNNLEHCKIFVNLLVNKAWNQSSYITTYSRMCLKLGNENTWAWAEGKNDEQKLADSKKRFKSMVVNKIRKEFLQGFKNYKETTEKNERDEEMEEDEVFERYNKDKKLLTGNMEFISELYKLSYLPHKVMRFITTKIITQFTDDFVNRDKSFEYRYPVHDELIEALINLFNFCGNKINAREKKYRKKIMEGEKDLCPYNKILDFSAFLINCCTSGRYNSLGIKKVISDEERKNVNCIDLTFTFLGQLHDSNVLGPRINSLIMNLKENKENGFKTAKKSKGPMKLKDFHEKLAAEKERERERGARRHGGGGGYGGRREPRRDRDDRGYDTQYTKKKSSYGGRSGNFGSGYQKSNRTQEGRFISTNEVQKKVAKR